MASGWTAADIPDQSGRAAVVTGANSGLGLAAARELAAQVSQADLSECRIFPAVARMPEVATAIAVAVAAIAYERGVVS